jgi:hypothetical protein
VLFILSISDDNLSSLKSILDISRFCDDTFSTLLYARFTSLNHQNSIRYWNSRMLFIWKHLDLDIELKVCFAFCLNYKIVTFYVVVNYLCNVILGIASAFYFSLILDWSQDLSLTLTRKKYVFILVKLLLLIVNKIYL